MLHPRSRSMLADFFSVLGLNTKCERGPMGTRKVEFQEGNQKETVCLQSGTGTRLDLIQRLLMPTF